MRHINTLKPDIWTNSQNGLEQFIEPLGKIFKCFVSYLILIRRYGSYDIVRIYDIHDIAFVADNVFCISLKFAVAKHCLNLRVKVTVANDHEFCSLWLLNETF